MKVIENNKDMTFRMRCDACESLLEFTLKDEIGTNIRRITCPVCGDTVTTRIYDSEKSVWSVDKRYPICNDYKELFTSEEKLLMKLKYVPTCNDCKYAPNCPFDGVKIGKPVVYGCPCHSQNMTQSKIENIYKTLKGYE